MINENDFYTLIKEGEVAAGSKEERNIYLKLSSLLKERTDQVRVEQIRVMNWELKHSKFYVNGEAIPEDKYVVLPYSPSSYEKGTLEKDFMISKINSLLELPFVYEKCYSSETCKALFVYMDDSLRKFVLKSGPFLQRKYSKPPTVPALYITPELASKVEKNKGDIELQIETSFNPYSVGFIIEGILNGKRESSIYITAHHDHWFNGFRDNMASLLTLLNIERSESELHLVSFTAEESGSPSFSSWSWSYGSLNFLEKRQNKLDNITLNINLDNLETSNIEALATPGISNIVYRLLNTKIEIDPYNDGYSFIKYGIPSIMIESRSSPVYHSNKDDLDKKIFSYAIKELPILIQKIIKNYIDSNKNYKEVTDFIKNESSYLTTNLKSYVTNLTEELFRKDEMIYRNILRLCGATITPIDSIANVKLFPVLYGVSNANKSYIDIENFGRIDRLIDNGYGLLREYLIYLDAIKEEYSEIYINEIYNALKKFF